MSSSRQAPALFNSRKNQIIRLHKNGMANAGSLTILRILQTKDNNIMSEKARQLDSIMCDKQQSLNIKALMEMEYAIQKPAWISLLRSLSHSLYPFLTHLLLCVSPLSFSLFLPLPLFFLHASIPLLESRKRQKTKQLNEFWIGCWTAHLKLG